MCPTVCDGADQLSCAARVCLCFMLYCHLLCFVLYWHLVHVVCCMFHIVCDVGELACTKCV